MCEPSSSVVTAIPASPPSGQPDGTAIPPVMHGCVLLLCCLLAGTTAPSAAAEETPSANRTNAAELADVRDARQSGRLATAMQRILAAPAPAGTAWALEAVLTARSADTDRDNENIDAHDRNLLYQTALSALQRSAANADEQDQRLLLRLAIASHFSQTSQTDLAADAAVEAIKEQQSRSSASAEVDPTKSKQLVHIALRLAWLQLNAGEARAAETLYQRLIDWHLSSDDATVPEILPQSDLALAMLGRGWAAGMQAERRERAAAFLGEFIDSFPEHNDVAGASAMRIQCLLDSRQSDSAAQAIASFLKRWPERNDAETIVLSAYDNGLLTEQTAAEEAVEQWILVDGTPQRWSLPMICRAIERAGGKMPAARFDFLLQRLGEADPKGQHSANVLNALVEQQQSPLAEQMAAYLISGDHAGIESMAREAACRWAGRTGRWTMLAMAAQSVSPPQLDERHTPHVDRLFAEALTRTGRRQDALQWWTHVVDRHQAQDFATLLRCAEAHVADGDLADAKRRLDQVQLVLDTLQDAEGPLADPREALVDLLRADLAVRKIEFDRARSLYESVIRSSAAGQALLGRAQWMIGETYFLQHKFALAIDAYRKVEGLDPGGPYVPAALVQAGKSFEQLGRTQQAGVCYGTLLGRFADSPHAAEARQRMAALPGTLGPNQRSPASGESSPGPDDSPLLDGNSRLRR